MRLISKTLLYYFLISLPLLLIAGYISYHFISVELNDGVDEALQKEELHVQKTIVQVAHPEEISNHDLIHISKADAAFSGSAFSNRVIYDSIEREDINYRVLTSYFKHQEQNYKIEIAKPSLEEEELREGLWMAFFIIGGFLLTGFMAVNWLLSKTLWKPFYVSLEKLKAYEIKNHVPESFADSSTLEFHILNRTLNQMTHKIYTDFLQQKEFTENASHEMQTPLAVIKANTSLLMQSPNVKAEEMSHIQAIDDTTKKLASLNKALLLLAKIENNQFKETSVIDMGAMANQIIKHFEDRVEARKIEVENRINSPLTTTMNNVLAEVLLTNLFQNAVRHNFHGGKIILESASDTLTICNSGEVLKINEAELFTRFKKNEASKESLGLGLAIVDSICALYTIKIRYLYLQNMHCFILKFNP